jgi:DNA repair photolyase
MSLNKSVGNMYPWITHTWNTIKGECPHGCTYCYMHRWGKQKPVHFDEKELKTDLGSGNFIFVGSSCDMFASSIPYSWTLKTLEHCRKFDNKYLFQSKNPDNILAQYSNLPTELIICTTIESDSFYPNIMGNSPHPMQRSIAMNRLAEHFKCFVTIEPIMDFHLEHFVNMLNRCDAVQINLGADTGHNNLPEPPKEKILALISELKKFTVVEQKSNLKRLLK